MHHIATHSSSIDKNVFNSGYYEKRANLFTKLAFSNPNFLTNNFDLTGECELNEKKSQFNDGLDPYCYLHEEEVEAAIIKPLLPQKTLSSRVAARSSRLMETGGLLLAQCAKDCGNDGLKMSLNQGRIGLFQVIMMATRCRQRLCQAAGKPSAPNGIGLRERHSILTRASHYPRHERVAEIADETGILYGRRSLFIRRCSLIRNRLIKMPRTNSWK